MSRIGKQPVVIPSGVQVKLDSGAVTAKGPKGELREPLHPYVKAEIKDGRVLLTADVAAARDAAAVWGMTRARVNNALQGVASGYAKALEVHGLGFRAEVAGQTLTLALGRSHPVVFAVPKGVSVAVDAKRTLITVSGPDKDLVGETAAKIRGLRKPEPYKGTGIRYQGEYVRRKAGKTAAGAGAGGKK
ncbi:MAG: 50S ribosomal protein L6 [Elusimicrobia bacterium]|nr:50S ribosomal protein L6 [Elusimicrobiota bacterium]